MKTIIWSVDDTLNSFTYRWFNHFIQERNAKFLGKSKIEYEDLIENPPHKILNYSKNEYLQSIDHFAEHHYELLNPNQDILNWFIINGFKFNNIILTACPLYRANISFEWVLRWFGKWIHSYNITPSNRWNSEIIHEETKADFIKKNFKHVDYFIDDNEKNCKEVELLGIKIYSINRPWNESNLITNEVLEKLT